MAVSDFETQARELVREQQKKGKWSAVIWPAESGNNVHIICPEIDMAELGTRLITAGEALFNGPEG